MKLFNIVRILARVIRSVLHVATVAVGAVAIIGLVVYLMYAPPPQNAKSVAIHHEFDMQSIELDRRIKVCNEQIDNFNPEYTEGPALHCAQMWVQMKRVQAFVVQLHIANPETPSLIEGAFRAAARYAEYQAAVNHPRFKPSDPSE